MLSKGHVIATLERHKEKLETEFDVKEISLFGSIARNEPHQNSDLDILVSFQHKATSKNYFGLQFFPEDLFHCKVDLATHKALREELRPFMSENDQREWRFYPDDVISSFP